MDRKTLLEQKRLKLEELKKQRLQKQQEFELEETKENREVEETEETDQADQTARIDKIDQPEDNSIVNSDQLESITEPSIKNFASEVSKIDVQKLLSPVLYKKSTDTFDLDIELLKLEQQEQDRTEIIKLKKTLEKQIRNELDKEYKKKFNELQLSTNELSLSLKSELTAKYNPPKIISDHKTPIKCSKDPIINISISSFDLNSVLTVHNTSINIWQIVSEKLLIQKVLTSHTTLTTAQFSSHDANLIIAGAANGHLYAWNINDDENSVISTFGLPNSNYGSVVTFFETTNSIIVLWSSGYVGVLAYNLVDIISKPELIVNNSENILITCAHFINGSHLLVGLITGDLWFIELGTQEIRTLINAEGLGLPVMGLDYQNGLALVCSSDNKVNVIDLSKYDKIIGTVNKLCSSCKWLTNGFVISGINNEIEFWKFENDKIEKIDNLLVDKDETLNVVKLLNDEYILCGGLNGKLNLLKSPNVI